MTDTPTQPEANDDEGNDLKTYELEGFYFSVRCTAHEWTITAKDAEDAERKLRSCINDDGDFDDEKFKTLGGKTGSWDTCDGTSHDFSADNVTPEEVED